MELSQEYFDQQLGKLVTKTDLDAALTAQTESLKNYTDNQTESLARIIALNVADPMEKHFAELKDLLQIKETVQRHEREIERLKGLLQPT
jgi:hypothetical protein